MYIEPEDLKNALTSRDLQGMQRDLSLEDAKSLFETAVLVATSTVASYVSRRYDVPSAHSDEKVPESIQQHTLYLAKFFLLDRVSRAPESVSDQREDAIRWLNSISKGDLDIPELKDKTRVPITGYSTIRERDGRRKSLTSNDKFWR